MTIRQLNPTHRIASITVPGVATVALLCLNLLILVPAHAVVMEKLFEVEIPVPNESKAIRQAALADGLAEVLVRVSGDSGIIQKLRPPSASAYVKQFRYVAIEPQAASNRQPDADQASHHLWVQYNSTRIMDLLRQQSIPIWSVSRSEAVVWLAVRDGVNQYILKNQDVSLLKNSAKEAFMRRGVPVIWPNHDDSDRKQLDFADVWAGFAGPLQKASKRYSAGPVVAASMTWNGRAWLADWSLFAGRESWRWNFEDTDYNTVIVQAIDRMADAMGETYAVLESVDASALEQVLVEIDNVNSVGSFRQVQDYLTSLSAIQSVWLAQIEPERVSFRLKLRTDIDDLLKLIKSDKQLTALAAADSAELPASSMVYRFRKK